MSALSEGGRVPPSVQGSRLGSPRLIPASQSSSRLLSRPNLESRFLTPSSHAIPFGLHASRAPRHRPRHRQRPSVSPPLSLFSSLTAAAQAPPTPVRYSGSCVFFDLALSRSSVKRVLAAFALPAVSSLIRTEQEPYFPENGWASVRRYLSDLGRRPSALQPPPFPLHLVVHFLFLHFLISSFRPSRASSLGRAV